MFTKNIFNQKDGIADLVGNILEADYKNKMEELKGDQHKIDKNKNNKIDAHDFKILRGEKPMQKEAAVTPHYTDERGNQYHYGASGYVGVKNKSGINQGQQHLSSMSDVHKKNYEKVHGMAWNQKNEEVEKKKENPFDALLKAARERQGPQPSGGSGMKKGTRYGGSKQKDVKEESDLEEGAKHAARPRSGSRPGTEPAVKGKLQDRMAAARERMAAKKKDVKEEAEQIDELNKDTVYSYNKKSMSATGKLDKQLGSQIRSGNAPEANKTAHKLNKRLAGQERADARLNKEDVEKIDERELTKGETAEKERIVKGMKKSLAGFKSRYGDKAKSVMYATATKAAKKD